MIPKLFLALLFSTSAWANYKFASPVATIAPTERGAVITCTDGNTLEVKFYTPEIVRITLVRPDNPEALLTDALLADSLLPHRHISAVGERSGMSTQKTLVGASYAPDFVESEQAIKLESMSIHIVVDKDSLHLRFTDRMNVEFLADDPVMAYGWDGNEVRTWKTLAPGEKFFGLGEKGGGLDKRGRELTLWNSDTPGYTDNSDPLYQSVPFYIGLRDSVAYGIFFNNSYKTTFNFGAGQQRYSSFSAAGGPLDYFVIYGPTIREVVQRFSELTGRMPMPPLWALGYQQSRWSYFPETEVRRLAETFREKDIPADVIYLDIHYMDGYRVFTWDSTRFPAPKQMLDDLARDGFKVIPIIDPGVKADSNYEMARAGLAGDHFVKYPDQSIHSGEVWPGQSYFPDFSNPQTRVWWGDHVAEFRKLGVRGFWNDMNEPACWGQAFPLETVFNDNGRYSAHKKMHNLYALHMAQATYEGLLKAYPNERPFILTRAGFAGMQRYAATWTGDNLATEEHLELGIRLMLGMGLSGQPFIGTDIGGFMGTPSPELFARWIEVGALSPFCRTHSHYGSNDKEPWSFGENIEEISRKFIKFRYELLPYLYTLFHQASETGEPIWRPLFYEFQDDPTCYDGSYQQQFMLGSYILVAPVTRVGQTTKRVYLPEGSWLDWNTEQVYEGKQEIIVDAPLDQLPMFLRNGTILFRRDVQDYADQKSIEELTIDIFDMSYEHESPYTSFTLYEDDGWSQDYHSGEQRIVGYNWGTSGACAILSRNEFKSGYKGPDRKLTLRFHNSNQTSVQYYLNDIPIRSTDARLKYDADKNILEVRLASEFNFKTFMIAARSPQEPERP
jgi:alpha-glucosidase